MLTCKEVTHQASDFVDDNLSWRTVFGMKLHLMMCGHCRRFMRHFDAAIKVARSVGKQDASEAEIVDIIKQINDIEPGVP